MTAKKKKKNLPEHPAAAPSAKQSKPLKPWQFDLIACGLIYLAVVFMFHEVVLQKKMFTSGDDTINSIVLNQYAVRQAETNEYPFWCPEMYGGFPSFAAGAYSTYEHMGAPYSLAYKWLSPRYWIDVVTIKGLLLGGSLSRDTGDSDWLVALMLYGGLLTYLLMRRLGVQVWIALFCGLVFAWNPYLISIITAAHGGKLMTFIYIPLIILLTWNLLQRRRLLDMALLALGFGWQVAVGGHTQILLYSGLAMAAVLLAWAHFEFREGSKTNLGIGFGMFLIAIILGVGIGSLWYIPLLNYVGYSIRGAGPALATEVAGYSLDQATMWSMMPGEMITFLFPSWYGLKSPFYWGGMPFTSSSFYFGALPLMFAVLALFGKKTRLMWALIGLSIFSILLSFGKYFETFYGFLFNYLPFFNKFRTPSLVLLLVIMSGIILSGYGIRFVLELKNNEKWKKVFFYGMIICAAVLIIALLGGDSVLGVFASGTKDGEAQQLTQQLMQRGASPQQASQQVAQYLGQLKTDRLDLLRKDIALVMLWLGLAFAACYLFVSNKLKSSMLIGAVFLITVVDLGIFSNKFFDTQNKIREWPALRPNNVTRYLQNDKSIFRVFPLGSLNQDNRWVAWEIDNFGGYHGAKMRSWQDVQDYVIPNGESARFPLNMSFLSAMNCKYLVANGPLPLTDVYLDSLTADAAAGMILYRNPRALERVYFADSVLVIEDRRETFRTMQDNDLLYDFVSIVDAPLPGPIRIDRSKTAHITSYKPHEVRIAAVNKEPSFLVLSDAHYAPGWEALIDGQQAHIYKVNGFARGLYLPPGDHSIIYSYTGKYERRGIMVATISYFLVIGLLIAGFFTARKRKADA
ncbi:hypothetical protein EH220_06070 [bacterium]|nr:MAG: hypothetical protein EH220_06070 [bacterium]